MGQSQPKEIIKDTTYELRVDEELNNMLKEEVKPVKSKINKNFSKKATKFLKLSVNNKIKKQQFFSKEIKNFNENENSDEEDTDEEEKEIFTNYITDLMDLIYTKNVNYHLKNRPNNTVFETIYDARNILNSEEDLNNNKYNIESCKIMDKLIEPAIPDKIINGKNEEDKENINSQEEGESNDDEKNQSQDEYFFKNWDYNEDIFENEKDEENEIELDLNLNKLKNNKNNKESLNNKNKLIFLDDIIKYKDDYDIKEIDDYISDVINLYKISPKNINNSVENNNINKDNNDSFESKNKIPEINSDKKIISQNKEINISRRKETETEKENFEIINNDEVIDESIKNINNSNNGENSEIISLNNKNVSKYFKDDENLENINLDKNEKISTEILNVSNSRYEQDNSLNYNINKANTSNNINIINNKNVFNKNFVCKGSKKLILKNPNIKLYQKKTIDFKNNNYHKDNSKLTLKNKANVSQNNQEKSDIDFNTISSIQKKENIDISNNIDYSNFNLGKLEEIYTHKNIRAKTPIIKKIRPKKIQRKKLIINNDKEEDDNSKPPEFEQDKLSVSRAKMIFIPKSDKYFRSKTPIKKLYKKTETMPKYNLKIDLLEEKREKEKMNDEINNIKKTITLVEEKVKSIEKMERKYKNIYNINNKYTNNNINISNITPISRNRRKKKKNKNPLLKTYEETDIKGYKDIMPIINKEKERKNKNNYNSSFLKRAKSTDIQLRKKKTKNEIKSKNNKPLDNYLFGKQKYYYQPIYQEKDNINNLRVGMRKKYGD